MAQPSGRTHAAAIFSGKKKSRRQEEEPEEEPSPSSIIADLQVETKRKQSEQVSQRVEPIKTGAQSPNISASFQVKRLRF